MQPPTGVHHISVIPIRLTPYPKPRPYEKPQLLPGLWLENINGSLATVAQEIPRDSSIIELTEAVVLDYPSYVQGLIKRLQLTEANPADMLHKLSQRHPDLAEAYKEHPLEIDVQEEDIRKLVIISCIVAGAQAIVMNRPVLAELTGASATPRVLRAEKFRHV